MIGGAAYAGRYYLTNAPRFSLHRVEVGGTRHASREKIKREIERHRGRNLFRLDLDRIESDLASFPWVRRVVLKRVLPNRISCTVVEREPRGLALIRGRVWLVDTQGEAIAPFGEKTREYSAPIFTGIDEKNADNSREQILGGMALLEFIRTARPGLMRDISEIDLQHPDRITLALNDGGSPVRLHPTEFDSNLERYLAMRGYLDTHFGDGVYVDLRFQDQIVFRPRIDRGR